MRPGAFLSMNHNIMPKAGRAVKDGESERMQPRHCRNRETNLPRVGKSDGSLRHASAAHFVSAATNYLPCRLSIERKGNGGHPMQSAESCQSGFHPVEPIGAAEPDARKRSNRNRLNFDNSQKSWLSAE